MIFFSILSFHTREKMTPTKLHEFRLFYNHTIHPELLRMEKKRKRLLRLLFLSLLFTVTILGLSLFLDILTVTLFLLIPAGFYVSYLAYQFKKFKDTFKPNVINLVLDFIDNDVNYGTLKYQENKFIPKNEFLESLIFVTSADEYHGEDDIKGKLGELPFEMCELNVREFSKVRTRLNYVFRGVFMHATLNQKVSGKILVLPAAFRQYLSRTIQNFNRLRGKDVREHLEITEFRENFLVYATDDAPFRTLLSSDMQKAIVDYTKRTKKEIYISILGKEIYIAVPENKDLLEPFIFQSNVSFDLIREFYEDIQLMIQIVAEFDEKI